MHYKCINVMRPSKLVDVVSGGSAVGQCFGPIMVPPVNFGAFFHSGK